MFGPAADTISVSRGWLTGGMGRDAVSPMEALSRVEGMLDGLELDAVPRGQRLACAQRARGLASRLTAMAAMWLATADAAQDSLRESGTPTTSWLAVRGGLSRREAAGLLHQARDLAERPEVAHAAAAGRISIGQARAIGTVLGGLGLEEDGQRAEAERILLGLAAAMDSDRLAKAAPEVLRAVAPDAAEEALERRLQRQSEAARRNRSLVFCRDGNGSITFNGSLPLVDGEAWLSILETYTESRRRTALEERDPLAEGLSPQQRRADALLDMIRAHRAGAPTSRAGRERPRVVVTVDYDKLRAEASGAGLIPDGQPVSAGDLRRLCCDAGILPAVLGGPGLVLDVGRSRRLVTPDLRVALELRDGGCAFPGCEVRPAACEAHHVVPWWADGVTALSNLILLCHHHHALVEPARYRTREQWEVRIAADGIPEAVPPRRCDPDRVPLRHARHRPAHISPPGAGPPGAPGEGHHSRAREQGRPPDGGVREVASNPADHTAA